MNETIQIKEYEDKKEAQIDKLLLESNGISSFIARNEEGGVCDDRVGGSERVCLLVDKNDAEEAVALLNHNR